MKAHTIQRETEAAAMSNSSALLDVLNEISEPILEFLSKVQYAPPEGSSVSIKSRLQSLLPRKNAHLGHEITDTQVRCKVRDLILCCAALASSRGPTCQHLAWIPNSLSELATSTFQELSRAYFSSFDVKQSTGTDGLGLDSMSDEKKLVAELMPEVMPLLKDKINESSIDKLDESDEISAASARTPVAYAIVASYQFRWFVTQVDYPFLGKLCFLVIPCALTALDHWSPEVKRQGMISFIHLARNVNSAELGWYEDVILDACLQNIASTDELWHYVIEMSVLLVTFIERRNPRSSWYEKMLNEMISHLERQPRNKERRIAWLKYIEPLLNGLGLVLLSHFRRLFPLFFQWMHADDDETVLLVLERVKTVIKLTWIRNSPYIERLIDELVSLYKEAALKIAREEIRMHVQQILILLQQCKGPQFQAALEKHRDDPNLTSLSLFSERDDTLMDGQDGKLDLLVWHRLP